MKYEFVIMYAQKNNPDKLTFWSNHVYKSAAVETLKIARECNENRIFIMYKREND